MIDFLFNAVLLFVMFMLVISPLLVGVYVYDKLRKRRR